MSGGRWLAATAAAYGLLHHVGGALAPLGRVGPTRWADWGELVTPYLVLLPAAAALAGAGASRRVWSGFAVGALTYALGSGIHLAANSVANLDPDPGGTSYLWDEVVGHHLWYGGAAMVFATLARVFADRPAPRTLAPYPLALLVGVTHGTNALEGGTVVLATVTALVFCGWGWRRRARLGRLLLVAYLPALLLIAAYGLWHGGFPQPSELGADWQ